ncbi:MAG: hypothetical protein TREMPRED_000617, partial [Tremellales sp. Tagirdzhanova-0007]
MIEGLATRFDMKVAETSNSAATEAMASSRGLHMIKCRSTEQEKPGVMNTCGTSLTTSATDVGRLSCTIAAATCAVTASAN